MESIDNLREYVLIAPSICSTTRAILVGYIDGIEREVADIVPLPMDTEGEAIHVGDILDGYSKTIEVVELRIGRSGWVIVSRDGNAYADCAAFTHHHAPTVEDVLREFGKRWDDPAHYAKGELVETFAAKLRLANSEE